MISFWKSREPSPAADKKTVPECCRLWFYELLFSSNYPTETTKWND